MLEIRAAKPFDADCLSELSRRTFIDTFAQYNSDENMNLYLAEAFSQAKQRAEIEDPRRTIYLAWIGDQAVGFYHLLRGEVDPAVHGENPIELLRLYVDKAWHGKAIGPALMDHCLNFARREAHKTIWLGVWEKNFRAQAFYRKYDFRPVGSHIFTLGHDPQIDLLFARSL